MIRLATGLRMATRMGGSQKSRAARRRAWAYRVRCITLFAFCLTSLPVTPPVMADPHPLVPPVACCDNYGVCPSRAAACIGLPCIPCCDPYATGAAAGGPWNLTLHEAISIALSNSQAVRNLGLVEAGSRNDIVRSVITTYDPLEADALAFSEWGIFDPLWTTTMVWDKQDIPPGTSFSGIGNRPPQLDTADFDTSLEQLLPMGTRVRADVVTNYLFNPQAPVGLNPNPQYFSYHQFSVTQPLLQGFGTAVTMAPIKIAAAEAERTDWQFKQEMLALVRSIETTYWSLYAQQQNLTAIEEVLPHFREVVRLRQEQAQTNVGTASEVARAESELYLFEQQRLATLSKIAENALVLRNLMGLPPDDCREIHLLAVPSTTKPFETLCEAINTAVNTRPDVLRQRLSVYVAQQERLVADNVLKPRLDLNGYWRTNGLGETLPDSWDSKATNDFNSWHMGVFFQMPLGRRQAQGGLRAAEYRLSRERVMLEQTAHQASYEVSDAYRRINWTYQQLEVVRSRQASLAQWREGARAQFENPPPGMTTVFALELYLSNLRDVTDARISANSVVAEYNSALARLEEVKGTLLENWQVQVAGDVSDTLPKELPTPAIQMPESVKSTPAEPLPGSTAPQAQPLQPATPAPAPAPEQGGQGAEAAPQISQPMGIAQQPADQAPRPMPLPMPEAEPAPQMQMPQSTVAPYSVVEEPVIQLPLTQVAPPQDERRDLAAAPTPEFVQPRPVPIIEMPQSIIPSWPPVAEAPDGLRRLPTAGLAMPDSVQPMQTPPVTVTRLPALSGQAESAPQTAATPKVASRAPKTAPRSNARSIIRMPESIRSAPSRLVKTPTAAEAPMAESAEAPVQKLPPAALQLPTSVQPGPTAGREPAPTGQRLMPETVLQQPESQRRYDAEAAVQPEPAPMLAAPMQLPESVRAAGPQAAVMPGPMIRAPQAPAMAQPMPVRVAQQPLRYTGRPPAGAQLKMPASMTVGQTQRHAAPMPAENGASIPRPTSSAGRIQATPISLEARGPELQFPQSIGTAVR